MVLYSPRTSPSGQEAPVAMLKLSADRAFADGVQQSLPFDTVEFIKGDAGRVITPLIGGICFAGGPGLWLAQCVLTLDTNVDRAQGVIGGSTGTSNINCVSDQANTGHLGSLIFQGQILIPSTDAPLSPSSPSIFCGFGVGFEAFGAAGNILAASSSLLIWPMYGFDV
jgi:hypothetical protein